MMIAAAIGRVRRAFSAPPAWVAVWLIGTAAGILAGREWLAVSCFLIAAPALLLTLFAELRGHEAPRLPPAGEPPDLAARMLWKRQRRLLESFARDRDPRRPHPPLMTALPRKRA